MIQVAPSLKQKNIRKSNMSKSDKNYTRSTISSTSTGGGPKKITHYDVEDGTSTRNYYIIQLKVSPKKETETGVEQRVMLGSLTRPEDEEPVFECHAGDMLSWLLDNMDQNQARQITGRYLARNPKYLTEKVGEFINIAERCKEEVRIEQCDQEIALYQLIDNATLVTLSKMRNFKKLRYMVEKMTMFHNEALLEKIDKAEKRGKK